MNARMLLFFAAGLLLLALLFVWLRPDNASAPTALPAGAPAARPDASGALDVGAGSTDTAVPQSADPAPAPTAAADAGAPTEQVYTLSIRGGQVEGPALIRVPRGTPLVLRITSDVADELHLHGYDLTLDLPAGQTAELRFNADIAGRFEYELHRAHAEIGALEVLPAH
jgi:hypothetical protein